MDKARDALLCPSSSGYIAAWDERHKALMPLLPCKKVIPNDYFAATLHTHTYKMRLLEGTS